ncbi:MAG: glycine betaine ABC transporter substrate-binding protein [Burkholderiaceae bacterium]
MAEAAARSLWQGHCGQHELAVCRSAGNIDNIILSKGYGCESRAGARRHHARMTAMMEKGQPDVAPEAWVNAVRQPLDAAVKDSKLHYAAESLKDGGVEGWWIPSTLPMHTLTSRPLMMP